VPAPAPPVNPACRHETLPASLRRLAASLAMPRNPWKQLAAELAPPNRWQRPAWLDARPKAGQIDGLRSIAEHFAHLTQQPSLKASFEELQRKVAGLPTKPWPIEW